MSRCVEFDPLGWYPIARCDDLALRHVYFGQLMGQELAVWRADDGWVNVWENRCLHRGVRLTIGLNEGRELKCQYHGWRYANRTAGCTYIPAHPADAPARTICNRTLPVHEAFGLVWTSLGAPGELATVSLLGGGDTAFALRNLPVDASAAGVLDALADYSFRPSASVGDVHATAEVVVVGSGPGWIASTSTAGPGAAPLTDTVIHFVQPVDAARSVVRSVLVDAPSDADRVAVLHHHNRALIAVRDRAEHTAARQPIPAAMRPPLQPLPIELASMPEPTAGGRHGTLLRVTVARRWDTADGIAAFDLRPVDGQLPTCQPGAHIDVHLPNGLVRQYSLTNGPGELDRYVIGVKREPASRGGSATLHDTVRQGDLLAISEPRHNFALRRDSFHTLLIAGGIGITPLLSMAQTLHHSGLSFELHYFAQSDEHVAFREVLDPLGSAVQLHLGLSPHDTAAALTHLVAQPGEGIHAYLCGPGPMLDAARQIAASSGWDDASVHFEYFANSTEVDTSSTFEVELARSAMTLHVEAGQSIVEVLRAAGVPVTTSCETGACGTCLTTVLDGEPDHQDVYLNRTERAAGDRMLVCVSRARTPRLVLDR